MNTRSARQEMNENRKDVSSSSGSTPTTSIQQGVQGGSQDVQQDLSTVDKLLASYTHHVSSPPDEMCSICLDSLQLPSDFDEDMKLKKDSQNKSQSQIGPLQSCLPLGMCEGNGQSLTRVSTMPLLQNHIWS